MKLVQGSALKTAVLVLALEFRVETTFGNDKLSQLLCQVCHVCVYVCVFNSLEEQLWLRARSSISESPDQMQPLFIFSLFFNFWLCWVFVAAHELSLVVLSEIYFLLRYTHFSYGGFSLQSTASRCLGFSNCSTWAQYFWCMDLVAQLHVGSSQTRSQTHVPCIDGQILNH